MIVGVMLAAVMQTVGQANLMQFRISERTRAAQLARLLMAEIVSQSYAEGGVSSTITLGAESGETRATYDDVDDYNGLVESPPLNHDGSAISLSGASTWRRTVAVEWLNPTTLASASPQADTGVKRITVTVYHRGFACATLSSIRTNAP